MSAVDLFILGWFIEYQRELPPETRIPTDWSPYELARFIETNHLQELAKVSTPTLYKNLVALRKAGFLKQIHGGGMGRAEKKRLSITQEGRRRFRDLMEECAGLLPDYRLEINPLIVNLDRLPAQEAIPLIIRIEEGLKKKGEFLLACQRRFEGIPFSGRAVIMQNIMLNETVLVWIREFKASFRKEYGERKGGIDEDHGDNEQPQA